MAPICGIPADTIREVARLYATSSGSMILWGMGISQHIHGTDNARCLIALALMTGQIGKPGTGLHPLRGQNNVQGASDAGLIPMMYPDYQRVDDPRGAGALCEGLGRPARQARRQAGPDGRRGHQGHPRRQRQGHVHHGRESRDERSGCRSCARGAGETRYAGGAGHLPDRDGLSGRCHLAGLVALPKKPAPSPTPIASCSSAARRSNPPGKARQDLEIIIDIARQLGLSWSYGSGEAAVAAVFDEMRRTMPSIAGSPGSVCRLKTASPIRARRRAIPATRWCSSEAFPTPTGKAQFRAGRHHSGR